MRSQLWLGLAVLVAACAGKKVDAPLDTSGPKKVFLDVHELRNLSASEALAVHRQDVAAEAKYGVDFQAFWVDEKEGRVYCMSSASSAEAVARAHEQGVAPRSIIEVKSGFEQPRKAVLSALK